MVSNSSFQAIKRCSCEAGSVYLLKVAAQLCMGLVERDYRCSAELELAAGFNCDALPVQFRAYDVFPFHDWTPSMPLTQTLQQLPDCVVVYPPLAALAVA